MPISAPDERRRWHDHGQLRRHAQTRHHDRRACLPRRRHDARRAGVPRRRREDRRRRGRHPRRRARRSRRRRSGPSAPAQGACRRRRRQLMSAPIPDILIIIALTLLEGFFVASEIALVSVRRSRIDQLLEEGNGAASRVRRLLDDPGRFLAVTQLGLTFLGFFASGYAAVSLPRASPASSSASTFFTTAPVRSRSSSSRSSSRSSRSSSRSSFRSRSRSRIRSGSR